MFSLIVRTQEGPGLSDSLRSMQKAFQNCLLEMGGPGALFMDALTENCLWGTVLPHSSGLLYRIQSPWWPWRTRCELAGVFLQESEFTGHSPLGACWCERWSSETRTTGSGYVLLDSTSQAVTYMSFLCLIIFTSSVFFFKIYLYWGSTCRIFE